MSYATQRILLLIREAVSSKSERVAVRLLFQLAAHYGSEDWSVVWEYAKAHLNKEVYFTWFKVTYYSQRVNPIMGLLSQENPVMHRSWRLVYECSTRDRKPCCLCPLAELAWMDPGDWWDMCVMEEVENHPTTMLY